MEEAQKSQQSSDAEDPQHTHLKILIGLLEEMSKGQVLCYQTCPLGYLVPLVLSDVPFVQVPEDQYRFNHIGSFLEHTKKQLDVS